MVNGGETGEREMGERETRHNNSPPTKKLRLRLGWGRGGVWVKVGLGWVGVVQFNVMIIADQFVVYFEYSKK